MNSVSSSSLTTEDILERAEKRCLQALDVL